MEYSIKAPDDEKDRIEQNICDRHRWDGVTPATKAEFVEAYLAQHLRQEVKAQEWETGEAQRTADREALSLAAKAAAAADTSLDGVVGGTK
jgi:hypothetical protein